MQINIAASRYNEFILKICLDDKLSYCRMKLELLFKNLAAFSAFYSAKSMRKVRHLRIRQSQEVLCLE